MIGWLDRAFDTTREDNPPRIVQSSLFFRDERFGLSELPFDLLIDESHRIEFDISDHAVENGATISDHVQERLRSVEVTGFFTNHPVGDASAYVRDGEILEEADEIELEGRSAVTNVSRDDRLARLKEIARRREPVRLVTALEVYDEMLVEELSFDRGPDDGESVRFRMRLREIRTAKLETRYVDGVWEPPEPKSQATDAGKKMSKQKKNGKKSATEKSAADAARRMEAALSRNTFTGA
nr:MAG TPA: hypothetical protein [Caudoviricetes sp.]